MTDKKKLHVDGVHPTVQPRFQDAHDKGAKLVWRHDSRQEEVNSKRATIVRAQQHRK